MVIFVLKMVYFRWIFTITRKIKIWKMNFHSFQHIAHLSCQDGHFWGGVCISLLGIGPWPSCILWYRGQRRSVQNQSENGKYNIIPVYLSRIRSRFIWAYQFKRIFLHSSEQESKDYFSECSQIAESVTSWTDWLDQWLSRVD